MNDRTSSAVRRLQNSPDFTTFIEYLNDELDIQFKTLVAAKDEILVRRAQGTIQHLQHVLKDVASVQH